MANEGNIGKIKIGGINLREFDGRLLAAQAQRNNAHDEYVLLAGKFHDTQAELKETTEALEALAGRVKELEGKLARLTVPA